MADTSDLKKGMVIKHQNDLWQVDDTTLVDQARGSAVIRVKMTNLSEGHNQEETFQSGTKIEIADIRHKNMQFLYKESERFAFMDQENYETIEINKDTIGEDEKYLKEGLEVIVKLHEGQPVSIKLPQKISYKVEQAPPATKGDTASGNVTKEVTLQNGFQVDVPIFIEQGEKININTETGEYAERAGA
ncbi:MAG: elongation factor P [Parcubacteria group bacterium QH_9_35_7]|nr:MAG: elongation factor P [Parcubacteria group bacterium QH_9_35_7]